MANAARHVALSAALGFAVGGAQAAPNPDAEPRPSRTGDPALEATRAALAARLDALSEEDRLTVPLSDGRLAQWSNWNNLWNNLNWLNWSNW